MVTFRERLPVEQFIEKVLIEMTGELSAEYASGQRVIKTIQEIDLEMWRGASLWLNDAIYIKDDQEEDTFFVGSSKFTDKTKFNIETIKELNEKQ